MQKSKNFNPLVSIFLWYVGCFSVIMFPQQNHPVPPTEVPQPSIQSATVIPQQTPQEAKKIKTLINKFKQSHPEITNKYVPKINNITEQDVECLAKNMFFEARNQGILGQLAVGMVTINRVVDKKYQNDICGVVWERKQFSWTHDGKSDRPKNKIAYAEAMSLALQLLDPDVMILDITDGATHYHANYVNPNWSVYMKRIVEIKDHIFYKPV